MKKQKAVIDSFSYIFLIKEYKYWVWTESIVAVLDYLEEAGLNKNILVVYGDNGFAWG